MTFEEYCEISSKNVEEIKESFRQEGRQEVVDFIQDILDKRVAVFLDKYPDKKDTPAVVMIEELKHSVVAEYEISFMAWKNGRGLNGKEA